MSVQATATVKTIGAGALSGPTPLLRLQTDDRLVALTRSGNQAAYEVLVARYQSRLQAFCRHMLGSKEDAEDVLQEVFAAAFNALLADQRPVNLRPWLYRIARNRCLNHLRKRTAIGVDSMDIHLADHGTTTADRVHQREEFRQLMGDVQTLPETQRTALLLREIDALSYEQIAEAMDTTVPSIKSLLVRARVSLAEAAEARTLTCEEVREELAAVAEGVTTSTAPVRRHVKDCSRCTAFKRHLKQTNKELAALFPLGPLLLLKKFLIAQAGAGGAAASTAGSTAVGTGISAVASKAAAGMAAAALVTAGAVEVDHAKTSRAERAASPVFASVGTPPSPTPFVVQQYSQPAAVRQTETAEKATATVTTPTVTVTTTPAASTPTAPPQQATDTTSLPPQAATPPATAVPVQPTPADTTPAQTTPAETTPADPVPADQGQPADSGAGTTTGVPPGAPVATTSTVAAPATTTTTPGP